MGWVLGSVTAGEPGVGKAFATGQQVAGGAAENAAGSLEAILRDFTGRFFRELDAEGVGSVTLPQVLDYVARHDEIADVSSVFGRAMVLGSRSDTGALLREAMARQAVEKERAEAAAEAKRLAIAAAAPAASGSDSSRSRGDDFAPPAAAK